MQLFFRYISIVTVLALTVLLPGKKSVAFSEENKSISASVSACITPHSLPANTQLSPIEISDTRFESCDESPYFFYILYSSVNLLRKNKATGFTCTADGFKNPPGFLELDLPPPLRILTC